MLACGSTSRFAESRTVTDSDMRVSFARSYQLL